VTASTPTGLTLDTGPLLALDRPGQALVMQARLAHLLKSRDIDIAIMTPNVARSVGLLCARTGHDDVVDVHVGFARKSAGVPSSPATQMTCRVSTRRYRSSGRDLLRLSWKYLASSIVGLHC
jgi:hypothetical protein